MVSTHGQISLPSTKRANNSGTQSNGTRWLLSEKACSECGGIVDAIDAFCKHCGSPFISTPLASDKTAPPSTSKRQWRAQGGRAIHELHGSPLAEVVDSLTHATTIEEVVNSATKGPGVYAIYGPASVWEDLRLHPGSPERPLYVGKHETNAHRRVLKEHFALGYRNARRPVTSMSSFRRSLAGLLKEPWGLTGIPRYPDKEVLSANDLSGFGLATPEQEDKLSKWMRTNLTVGLWIPDAALLKTIPEAARVRIVDPLEKLLKAHFLAPCNVDRGDPVTPWTRIVEEARRSMGQDAKAWAEAKFRRSP